jgi:predicted flap endonuclease-1-like 5' DNA nuclease
MSVSSGKKSATALWVYSQRRTAYKYQVGIFLRANGGITYCSAKYEGIHLSIFCFEDHRATIYWELNRSKEITGADMKRRFNIIRPAILLLVLAGVRWFNQSKDKTAAEIKQGAKRATKTKVAQQEDDLIEIEGIGPKSAGVLHKAGITTFSQLAKTDPQQLREILREADMPSINPDTWPEQARLAAKGDWDGLYALRDELVGGRRV